MCLQPTKTSPLSCFLTIRHCSLLSNVLFGKIFFILWRSSKLTAILSESCSYNCMSAQAGIHPIRENWNLNYSAVFVTCALGGHRDNHAKCPHTVSIVQPMDRSVQQPEVYPLKGSVGCETFLRFHNFVLKINITVAPSDRKV